MKDLLIEFLESGICECCGSQRCDQSLEWIDGCAKWKEFFKRHIENLN